jgi:spore coat protein U-like protein
MYWSETMKAKLLLWLSAIMLSLISISAQAAITCTAPSSTGFSTAYAPLGVVPNTTQGQVSFTCTRSSALDATNLLLRANNGVNVCAGSNDASFGGQCINYEAYQTSACTTVWTANSNASSIPITLLSVLTPQPITVNFWGCITVAGQNKPAGTYTDTVTISVRTTGGTLIAGASSTMPVSITNPATCAITSIGNVTFGTYTALQTTALVAPTATITLNCTTKLPYTMSLDANSGVIAGLNYNLTINSVTPPVSSRGTGPGQTHTITGTMPANQAGTCATGTCSATQMRTLTITY